MTEQDSQAKSSFYDDFDSPDFYLVDDLLSEEHLLVRSAMRDFVKQEMWKNYYLETDPYKKVEILAQIVNTIPYFTF